jgi:hypothetical protein
MHNNYTMSIALLALFFAACGGESFTNELFVEPRDGGQEAGPVVAGEAAPVGEDAPPVSCTNGYLRLPGDDGAYAVLSNGPGTSPPIFVEASFRLETGDSEVRVLRAAPENPCGWSLTVRGNQVKATVTALFDHYVTLPVFGAGWLRIGWRYDGVQSHVLVDGKEVSTAPKPSESWSFPNCSGPARVEGMGRVDDVAFSNSHWQFDEKDGATLVPVGELIGAVTRECR